MGKLCKEVVEISLTICNIESIYRLASEKSLFLKLINRIEQYSSSNELVQNVDVDL